MGGQGRFMGLLKGPCVFEGPSAPEIPRNVQRVCNPERHLLVTLLTD